MRGYQSFWFGFLTGIIVLIGGGAWIWSSAETRLRDIVVGSAIAVIALAVTFMLALAFREAILKRLIGKPRAQLEDVITTGFATLEETLNGDRDAATQRAKDFAGQLTAWYSWITFYRWVFGTCISLMVAIAAFAGTVLLFEQNKKLGEQTELLAQQNERFDKQNELASLSLVSELRQRLMSSGKRTPKWSFGPLPGANCHLKWAEHELDLPANPSEVSAIHALATEGILAAQVREALVHLQSDSSSAVRLAATEIMLAIAPEDIQYKPTLLLENMYVPHRLDFSARALGGPIDQTKPDTFTMALSVRDSFIDSVDCEDCQSFRAIDSVAHGKFGRLPVLGDSLLLPSEDSFMRAQFPRPSTIDWSILSTRLSANGLIMAEVSEPAVDSYSDILALPASWEGLPGTMIRPHTAGDICASFRAFAEKNPFFDYVDSAAPDVQRGFPAPD